MEQRLIDANALMESAETCRETTDAFQALIKSAPTVDAVPVRCGQCKYYSHDMNCCAYVNGLQNVTKTDYCSYGRCADGERRTE